MSTEHGRDSVAEVEDVGALDVERIELLRSLGDSAQGGLLPALTEAFAASALGLVAEIRAAAERGDRTALREPAHQLAGAAVNIGAMAAAAVARSIERSAVDPGHTDAADAADAAEVPWARLDAEVRRAIELLAQALPAPG